MAAGFDLDAYLARVGLKERPRADLAGVSAVQRAQRMSIPFENLDIWLGRGISLDPERVFDKLVTRRRGGYCFEQNQLFRRALEAIGVDVRQLMVRVWLEAVDVPPRTHTLLLVVLDGEPWIADAGFGDGLTPILPLVEGQVHTSTDGVHYRLVPSPEHGWMLERARGEGAFRPQYSFTLDSVWPADLIVSNHYASTMPGFRFVAMKFVNLATPSGLTSLIDRQFSQNGEKREIVSAADYRDTLADVFGIDLTEEEIERLGPLG